MSEDEDSFAIKDDEISSAFIFLQRREKSMLKAAITRVCHQFDRSCCSCYESNKPYGRGLNNSNDQIALRSGQKCGVMKEMGVKFKNYLLCGEKLSVCLVGIAADCVAVCCCPLALLQLLAFLLVKMPSILAFKTVVAIKSRICKRNRIYNILLEKESESSSSCQYSFSEDSSELPLSKLEDDPKWKDHFGGVKLGFGEFEDIKAYIQAASADSITFCAFDVAPNSSYNPNAVTSQGNF